MLVLVVDDERLARQSLADYLRDVGYPVTVVASGEAALEAQAARPHDVCIVDIRMPDMDGVEAIMALHQVHKSSRFIIYTGSPQFVLPQALKRLGIAEHHVVRKPVYDMEMFVNLIKEFSSSAGQGRAHQARSQEVQ